MNQQVADFIKQILEQIKYKKVHPYIKYEIQDHIEMLKDEYMQKGLNEEAAYNKALLQMGDAQLIGAKLNQTHKPHMQWSIIILVSSLLLSGFILTAFIKYSGANLYEINLVDRFKHMIIAIMIFMFSYFLDYNILKKCSMPLYLFTTTLMIYCLMFGITINGRKVYLMGISIMPILVLFWLLSYIGLTQKFSNKKNNLLNMATFFLITVVPIVLTTLHSQYNAFILMIGFSSTILVYNRKSYDNKSKLKLIFILASTLLAFILPIVFKVFKYEYMLMRLKSFIFPNEQQLFIRQLLGNSKLLGNSNMFQGKFLQYISNFRLTFIISQVGIIAGIFLIAIIALTIVKMFKTTISVKEDYGKALSIVILTVFTIKFVISIVIDLGLLAITYDCYMPFISDGGVSLVTDMAMLGVFLGVYRKKDILLPVE